MRWSYFARLGAAGVLVACLFLPLSTCTHQGRTTVKVPIHDVGPVGLTLIYYCVPLALIVAEGFRPRGSTSGLVLVALQVPASVFSAFQIYFSALFDTPLIGWYLALGALLAIFVAAVIEIVRRVRMRRSGRTTIRNGSEPAGFVERQGAIDG